MRIVEMLSRLMSWLSGDKQPAPFTTNEVNKALLDDALGGTRHAVGNLRLLYRHDPLGIAGQY